MPLLQHGAMMTPHHEQRKGKGTGVGDQLCSISICMIWLSIYKSLKTLNTIHKLAKESFIQLLAKDDTVCLYLSLFGLFCHNFWQFLHWKKGKRKHILKKMTDYLHPQKQNISVSLYIYQNFCILHLWSPRYKKNSYPINYLTSYYISVHVRWPIQ